MISKSFKITLYIIVLSLAILLLLVNKLIYSKWLRLADLVAVCSVVFIYFLIIQYAILMLWTQKKAIKYLYGTVLAVVLFSLFDVMRYLIYDFLPLIDVVLYNVGAEYNEEIFRKNILSTFLSVCIAAVLFAVVRIYSYQRRQKQVIVKDLQYRIGLSRINPHFFEGIFSTALGRSLMGNGSRGAAILVKLAEVMRYVLDRNAVSDEWSLFKDEWIQVQKLIDLVRWKYGEMAIQVQTEGIVCPTQRVISLSILTILENAIKYADWSVPTAIQINISSDEYQCAVEIINSFCTSERLLHQNSKFGLQNLKERIQGQASHVHLIVKEQQSVFRVLIINKAYAR